MVRRHTASNVLTMHTQSSRCVTACTQSQGRNEGTYNGNVASTFSVKSWSTFLSYISNACHSLSGVAERLQHTMAMRVAEPAGHIYTGRGMYVAPIYHIMNSSSKHGHLLKLLATPVVLCWGWHTAPTYRGRWARPQPPDKTAHRWLQATHRDRTCMHGLSHISQVLRTNPQSALQDGTRCPVACAGTHARHIYMYSLLRQMTSRMHPIRAVKGQRPLSMLQVIRFGSAVHRGLLGRVS